ncbi:MAG: type II toxin-antitoxin system Phd/YefM family antitoxin [Alphaproteobacteria bacterium]|nr:type II toxin-antitoxin system Phd/YefM family antitoxin [Alphaproteobacteria bacterium]MBM3626147.1 type II toxin-antitoxin system Phd/YefM family antitoxin [Alphaproteobacteria bacterium]MBM3642124.1 type II toxin-antitoxin system Phd/YefM family antitoxin [Alphaproteobacteria bacterium]
MKCVSAKDAKNGFGWLLDTARAEPVIIEKHGRAVIVVLAIEEYERLVSGEASDQSMYRPTKAKGE